MLSLTICNAEKITIEVPASEQKVGEFQWLVLHKGQLTPLDNFDKPEKPKDVQARWDREESEERDVALNKAEVREGRYWVDGKWVATKNNYKPAKNENELKDSDNDGYDDYTEFKHGTSPHDAKLFPAIRDGNNKVVFQNNGTIIYSSPNIDKKINFKASPQLRK